MHSPLAMYEIDIISCIQLVTLLQNQINFRIMAVTEVRPNLPPCYGED